MKTAHDIIIRPIITEASMQMTPDKKYVFEVLRSSNKIEVKKAIEEIFKVDVQAVNIMNVRGKKKRLGARPQGTTPSWKKAIVTLKPSSKTIEFFDGMY